MTALELLSTIEARAGCLIPRCTGVPSCHEKTFCDCTPVKLAKMLRVACKGLQNGCYCQDMSKNGPCTVCETLTQLDEIASGGE